MAHSPRLGHVGTVEAFAKYSFPSNISKSLSSIFYEELLLLTDTKDVAALALGVCNIMFTLWSKCREDDYVGNSARRKALGISLIQAV